MEQEKAAYKQQTQGESDEQQIENKSDNELDQIIEKNKNPEPKNLLQRIKQVN